MTINKTKPSREFLALFPLCLILAGCAGSSAFKRGKQLETTKDYDEALHSYQEALQKEPRNHEYRLYFERARFQAALAHFDKGRKLKEAGQLDEALGEFQRAYALDPSNTLAAQETKAVQKILEDRQKSQQDEKQKVEEVLGKGKTSKPKEALSPIYNVSISIKLTGDLKKNYEYIAKVGGINVIFDNDLRQRLTEQAPIDLNNVTVVEALDLLALQSKTYWSVLNKNTILVANDNQQTRQTYEEQVIKTLYLGNSLAAQDLTETITMLRLLLNLTKIAPISAQNAIVIRDTPDKIAMAEKILQSVDKAKPEVLIDVAVLEVDRNLTRTLGIQPPGSTSLTFSNPPGGGEGSSSSISLKDLSHISSANFSINIPSTSIDAFATRANGKILQNPSLRASDGKKASLRVGTKQPVAQGSFQPTFAGNIGGTPVVNFTYIDVGVNLDLTPRVLLNREIAITTKVEVNAIANFEEFGGGSGGTIRQPVLTQRSVEHDIRLKEGESNIIGGIIQDTDLVTISGVPGVNRVPLLRYLFSKEVKDRKETEIIIIITPHILRLPEYLDDDYESIAVLGAGNNPRLVGRPIALLGDNPIVGKAPQGASSLPTSSKGPVASSPSNSRTTTPVNPSYPAPRLAFVRLSPSNTDVAAGSRLAVSASIENAQNASALTFNLSFNPKVLKLVDVQNGGFLSSDGKIIALAPRIENENGRAVISLTRPPDSSGLNGKGVLVNLYFEAMSPGASPISFTEASNVRDSKQTTLPTSFSSTQVVVK